MSLKTITHMVMAAIFGGAVTAFATQQYSSHGNHIKPVLRGDSASEMGQSAFAAIAEIVHILESNPNTDWSKVNIPALRNHLVNMNDLTLRARVERTVDNNSVTFIVTGQGSTLDAIKVMVPAHAKELEKMADWSASATLQTNGAKLRVQPVSENKKYKVLGLGFFGLMATGSHHQLHHLGMATGQMTH